jgi:hypothetical protein
MQMRDELRNTVEQYGLLWFDTGGKFWTPAWDFEQSLPKACKGYVRPNGTFHLCGEGMVTAKQARNDQIKDCGAYFGKDGDTSLGLAGL